MNPNTQQAAGGHLLFIRGTHWHNSLSPADLQRVMTDFYAWVEDLRQKGVLLGAQPLMEEGKLAGTDVDGLSIPMAPGAFMTIVAR